MHWLGVWAGIQTCGWYPPDVTKPVFQDGSRLQGRTDLTLTASAPGAFSGNVLARRSPSRRLPLPRTQPFELEPGSASCVLSRAEKRTTHSTPMLSKPSCFRGRNSHPLSLIFPQTSLLLLIVQPLLISGAAAWGWGTCGRQRGLGGGAGGHPHAPALPVVTDPLSVGTE